MSVVAVLAKKTTPQAQIATSSSTETSPSIEPSSQHKTPQYPLTAYEILSNAKNTAFKGGLAGASAQVINVFSLMWLRTTMNYQYRYGGNMSTALNALWRDGGVPRFYRGLIPALIQSPLSRFGDTAANAGVLSLLDSNERTANLPVSFKTALCSTGAASFRLLLMPIDAWKTVKQVEGGDGLKALTKKAAFGATFVGHYPWFFTFNYLNGSLPQFDFSYGKHVRNASIGFTASVTSDCISNSIRVLKTTKQTNPLPLTYKETIAVVVEKDGLVGLFGRGLKTRILTNGLQGMVFTIGWRSISEALTRNERS